MPLTKLKIAMSFSLAVLALGLVTYSALAQQTQSAEERKGEKANQAISKPLRTLQGHRDLVMFVTFSPDGKTLASASQDGTIKLWEAATGKEGAALQGHRFSVRCVAFSPDGKTLASGSNDGTVKLWEAATGKEGATFQGLRHVVAVTYSPDGKTLTSRNCENTVKLWEVATGKERATFEANSVAYSPDGKVLASADEEGGVMLRDTTTGNDRAALQGHTGDIYSVAYSRDGKTLASTSGDMTVKLWEVATGKERATFQGNAVPAFFVAFSPDGKTLATRGNDKAVKLWDLVTGAVRATLQLHSDQVGMVYSPDSKILATGGQDNTLTLWDVATGKACATLQGHTDAVVSAVFSPDGKSLASASHDKTVKLWDVPATHKSEPARSVFLTPEVLDGLWPTLASDDAVKAYRAIRTLAAAPDQAVSLARKHLRPASKPTTQDIPRWIGDLNSDRFAVRDKASRELAKMGEQAEVALRKELAGNPSPEVRERIERLLSRMEQPSLELLRELRAVEVLEQVGNSEAKKVLETLAAGSEGFRLTTEAKASLDRMNKRVAADQENSNHRDTKTQRKQ